MHLSPLLTDPLDRQLRCYARWLSPDHGEDAYHTCVLQLLERGLRRAIVNHQAFFRCAIKLAFYKIMRHERAEREQVASWLAGDPPHTQKALTGRRVPQSHCRRGHALVEENLSWIGPRRTCLMCRRVS